MVTAEDKLPPRLCKFRSFGATGRNGEDKERVYELLRGRIHFAPLSSFNDPFEGRPFPVPAFADADLQRAAVERYLRDILRESGRPASQAKRQIQAYLAGKSMEEITYSLGIKVHDTLRADDVILFCVSAETAVAAPLAWSHYADSHRGVCIHFTTSKPPFSLAWAVSYSDEYPETVFPRTYRDNWEGIKVGLLRKCSLWWYEHEHRMARVSRSISDGLAATLGVEWDGNVALADPRAIEQVTLGTLMPEAYKQELITWIRENTPHIEIWQADLHPRKYEITRTKLVA